ncbi:MAG: hypothetical protein ABI151_12965 [Chitinophagaceae bacterium]
MIFRTHLLSLICVMAWQASTPLTVGAQSNLQAKQILSSSKADTWVATDGIGRKIITDAREGTIRKDKFVGIFYFIWQGAHGYDKHSGTRADEGVMEKAASDTVSPYDISKLLAANAHSPAYGPVHAFHYWGEPYFGYYLPDDEWIIRKHAQMLSDAGIDVLIIDVTNAAIYLPQVTKIAQTYMAMRAEGKSTPSLAFIANSAPERTVQRLYDSIYKKNLFANLWFYWKGKPLLLCPPQAVTKEIASFFTTRHSWAWSKDQKWFEDGKDKWPWLDHTPQNFGWHEAKDKPEEISVAIAEHPMSNIGRSFHDGKEPDEKQSGKGLYFSEQWKRAREVDPEFVFVTGWNEWVAMRFNDGKSKNMIGKPIKEGETYFVDLYNEEFSRDAEPVKGAFNDNYYYQLVDNVRKFKGSRAIPVYNKMDRIAVDGSFIDWQKVEGVFLDDRGDVLHRKHPGWGRIKEYINNSGRNDIIEAKVTSDPDNIYFYVKTANTLTPWNSPDWMRLLISINGNEKGWEGFGFIVNRMVQSKETTTLESSSGNWAWKKVADIKYRSGEHELELLIPKKTLGLSGNDFTIDFKWADNSLKAGNVMDFLDKGDAAPNGRFAYRYIKKSTLN